MRVRLEDGLSVYWRSHGDSENPPLLMLNSIGTDLSLWGAVSRRLSHGLFTIRMDARGHGRTQASDGDYTLEQLAGDAVALLDTIGLDRVAVAGVSLGGMIAMQMALDWPERVSALIPVCTSAEMDKAAWAARVDAVRAGGTEAIADLAMSRFLSPAFISEQPGFAQLVRDRLIAMEDRGYAGAAAAIRDMQIIERLPQISCPTLVIAGDRDQSTPFSGHGDRIFSAIPRARAVHIDCAHLAPLEAPAELARHIHKFLAEARDND